MKKYLFIVLLFSVLGFSQNGISYQALILNPTGQQLPGQDNPHAPISNKLVCLKFSIVDHTNQIEYLETHKITTDAYGIVNLVIGTGEQIGGYAANFSDIVWGNNPKSLKVDLDVNAVCTYFVEISNQPFTYIPFAYYAANAYVQDATPSVKGIIRLGGDLGGTGTSANAPIISNNAIVSAKISNGAVTPIKIAPGSNNTVLVTDNTGNVAWLDSAAFNAAYGAIADLTTIEGTGIATDPFKVKDLGIITSKIADAAITSNKLANAAVTTSKIASGSNNTVLVTDNTGNVAWLDSAAFNAAYGAIADLTTIEGTGIATDPFKVKDLGIITSKIADAAITSNKLANAAVTTSKIASGSNNTVLVTDNTGNVAWLDSAAFNAAYGAIADLTTIEGTGIATDPFKVKDLGIITSKIADAAITSNKLANAAVTTSKIASGSNNTVLVTDNTGNVAWLDSAAFNAAYGAIADLTTIEGTGIATNPFKVKDLGIITSKIADAAITTNKLSDSSVTTVKIADSAITTSKIASGGNDKILITDATGNVTWIDGSTIGTVTVPDATTSVKGKLQLSGDLAGTGSTAATPIVSGLQGIPVASNLPTTGQILYFNGTSWVPTTAPAEVDGIIGNEVTDAVADGGLTRSGTGTAADPYKLKINDGTTNGQILTWDGTKWVAQAAPAEVDGIIGNEVTDAVADGGLTRSGTGTTADPYKLKINDGTTNGQILTWDGTKWVAQAAPAEVDGIIGNEVTDAVADGGLTRSGTGTTADPYKLKINDGTTNGQILTWDGTKWVAQAAPAEVDGIIGNEVTDAVADGGLTRSGTGTTADPYKLKINDGTTNGQILTWDGTKWVAQAAPAEVDGIIGNEVTDAVADGGLTRSGTGTAADPYKLKINDGTTNGQILTWDGTKWVAQAAPAEVDGIIGNEVTDAVADGGLTRSGTGTTADPYKLKINDGTTNGQILTWDGTKWVAQAAPVEVDGIIGNEVTDAVADGGLTRSGTGTTADPYKLKINDGTTNGQILTWDGTKWVAQAAPAEVDGIIGNEVTDAVADGGLTRSGTGTTADPYKLKINDGTTNGQILTWDGTKWVAQAAPAEVDGIIGNEVTDAVADGGLTRSGTGTTADPYKLKINDGTTNGQILTWDGTKWVAQAAPAEVDGIIGNEVTDAVADGGLTRSGTGTAADPYKLKINDGTTNGQILTWDGTKWVAQAAPAEVDGIIGNEVTDAVADGGLTRSGTGTTADPYKLKINDGTTNGQILTWDGTKWVAQAAPAEVDGIIGNEVTDAVADGGLTRSGTGTTADPYKLKINDGTTNGQILTWDGTKWVAQAAPAEVDGIIGNEVTDAVADGGLTRSGTGTTADPYKLKINDGTANEQVLTWDGSKWIAAAATNWKLTGNAGTTAGTNFIGTTDAQDLVFKTNDTEKLRILSNGNLGIATLTPASKLDIKGPIGTPLIATASNITLDNTHAVVKVNATLSDVNVTLPDPTTVNGRTYIIIKTDSSINKLIFNQTITGNEFSFNQANVPGSYQIQSDGSNWNLIK